MKKPYVDARRIRQYARLDSRIDFIPLKTEAGDTTRYVRVHI